MTQESKHRLLQWIDSLGAYAGRISAIAAVVILAWTIFIYGRAKMNDISEKLDLIPELKQDVETLEQERDRINDTMDGLLRELNGLKVAVDAATIPRDIFEIDLLNSGPRDNYCVPLRSCLIDYRLRRTIEGLPCEVIQGSERFYFVSSTGQRIQTFMISGTPTQQVGRDWFDYHRVFELPEGLIEPVAFMYDLQYKHCRGPEDERVIMEESEMIPIRVLTGVQAQQIRSHTPNATVNISPDNENE